MPSGAEYPTRRPDATLRLIDYGTAGDAVKLVDGALNVGDNTLTSASAAFAARDVGKQIAVEAAATGYSARGKITSGSNALQQTWVTLKIVAQSGTFPITFNAQTYNGTVTAGVLPSAATVQAGLEALSSIGVGNVDVSLTGSTYTISLHAGASSTDTNLFSTSAASLVALQNGPVAAATLTTQTWWYGQVGLRIHVPGAGVAGGVLTAWVGYIEPVDSRIAYLYDTPPTQDGPQGNPLNASTTVNGVTYNVLNWARGTISTVNSATSVTLSFTASAGVLANLSGLEVHYGTDDTARIASWLADCRSTGKAGYAGPGVYLCTAGQTSSAALSGLTLSGAGEATVFRHIVNDSEAESGRWTLGGTADSLTGRAQKIHVRLLRFEYPCAHTRGSGTLAGFPQNKTNAGCLFISKTDGFSVVDVSVDNCYGVGITPVNSRFGIVENCRVTNAWGNGIDVQNSNATVGGPGTSDITVADCRVANSGDDMYAIDNYQANGRIRRVSFVGCTGYATRQYGLGRGIAINGGDDILVSGCQIYNTNGPNYDVDASKATNSDNTGTISTPGGVTTVVWSAAQPNITAGVTNMRLFKNDGSGTTWIGDVATVSGDGKTITLTATANSGSAETCPFTGASSLAQWGDTGSGFRFGVGGSKRVVISGCIGDGSNINPANDGTLYAALRIRGGAAITERVTDVQVDALTLNNCYETGVLVNTIYTASTSDQASQAPLVSEVNIANLSLTGTGFSSLAALRPWPGVYIQAGQNITVRAAKIRDTDDNAVLVANGGTALGGRIRLLDIEASDIGRTYTNGAPLAAAFDPGTSTTFSLHAERLFLTNPAGTAGGTQYVATVVLGETPTGSTVRGVNSDITGQTLQTESASRYRVVVSPVMFRGKGTPEGTVTASVGAIYERTDGASGTTLYVKESGTGNTGWIAYAAPGGSPAPELDMVYGAEPLLTYAAAVWGLANRAVLVRLRGNGSISNLVVSVKVQSGNYRAAIFANTGSGRNARPTGAPLVDGALTAVGAVGQQAVPLSGAQAITHLNFWGAVLVDNITASFDRVSATNGDGTGFCHSYDSASNDHETIGVHALSASGSYVPWMVGT